MADVLKTVTAQNTYSDALSAGQLEDRSRLLALNVSVWGTFVATVTLQRSFDGGVTWLDVATYTNPVERIVDEVEPEAKYRIGVKTGEFTSGTVELRLGRPE